MANAVGRPSDYSPETLDKAIEYCKNYEKLGDVVPSVVGLCLYLDIAKDTGYRWSKDQDKKEFSYIFGKVLQIQEQKLINGGLKEEFKKISEIINSDF